MMKSLGVLDGGRDGIIFCVKGLVEIGLLQAELPVWPGLGPLARIVHLRGVDWLGVDFRSLGVVYKKCVSNGGIKSEGIVGYRWKRKISWPHKYGKSRH